VLQVTPSESNKNSHNHLQINEAMQPDDIRQCTQTGVVNLIVDQY